MTRSKVIRTASFWRNVLSFVPVIGPVADMVDAQEKDDTELLVKSCSCLVIDVLTVGSLSSAIRGGKAAANVAMATSKLGKKESMGMLFQGLKALCISHRKDRTAGATGSKAYSNPLTKSHACRACLAGGTAGLREVSLGTSVGRHFFGSKFKTPSSNSQSAKSSNSSDSGSDGPSTSESETKGLELLALIKYLDKLKLEGFGNIVRAAWGQGPVKSLEAVLPDNGLHGFAVVELSTLTESELKRVQLDWGSDGYCIEEVASLSSAGSNKANAPFPVTGQTIHDLITIIEAIDKPYSVSEWNCNHWSKHIVSELSD